MSKSPPDEGGDGFGDEAPEENGKRKQRRYRTTFSADQLEQLEKVLLWKSCFLHWYFYDIFTLAMFFTFKNPRDSFNSLFADIRGHTLP